MADWDFNLLESLIQQRGDIVTAETAIACMHCRNEDDYASTIDHLGQPAYIKNFACPYCQGNGYLYRNARKIKGLVSSVTPGNRELLDVGYASPGDATFSPSIRDCRLSDFDRITFCNTSTADNSQVILRGAATLAENGALKTDLNPNEDRLMYNGVNTIWCEDSNNIVYTQGADFRLSGNKIIWINSPDVGTIYTIKYQAQLEWIVYSAPMERFDNGRNLGQKVLLKKKHVHFKLGSPASTAAERTEETVTKI